MNIFKSKSSFEQKIAQLIFEHSPDSYLVLENSKFIHCNKAAETSLDLPKSEIIGRNPADFSAKDQLDGRDPVALVAANTERVRKHGWTRFEWLNQKKDGTPLPLSVTLIAANIDGRELEIVFWQDIRDLDNARQAEKVAREKERQQMAERETMIARVAEALHRLAAGDLTFRLNDTFPEDSELLRHDLNNVIARLGATLGQVAHSTATIKTGTTEINKAASNLAKRTEQQAAALEETAAALEEITTNVANSSKRADEARAVATEARSSAVRSGEIVAQAMNAMRKIETSSQQISSIIRVIDEIAFQTNLLALNAGVEAARAGDAGKGFAVVAQEVRELAQRSASAAKEIRDLVRNSTAEVESGVEAARSTGESLKTISDFVVEISQHIDVIATSAREQSDGLQQVNNAINQMDRTTQQNAAMVEENNSATAILADEANRLRELIGKFEFNRSLGDPRAATHDDKGITSSAQALHQTLASKLNAA